MVQAQVHKGGQAVGVRCGRRGVRGARARLHQGRGQEAAATASGRLQRGRVAAGAAGAAEVVEEDADVLRPVVRRILLGRVFRQLSVGRRGGAQRQPVLLIEESLQGQRAQ